MLPTPEVSRCAGMWMQSPEPAGKAPGTEPQTAFRLDESVPS